MAHFPKYEKVKRQLMADIRSGVYATGEKIPTREELILKFGVTRTTINQALKELVDSGVLSTSRRGGTVVTGQPLPRNVAILSWLADPNIMGSAHDDATTTELLNPVLMHAAEFHLDFRDIGKFEPTPDFFKRFDCVVAIMPTDAQLEAFSQYPDKVLFINRYGDAINFISSDHRGEVRRLVARNLELAGADAQMLYVSGSLDACGFVGNERRAGFNDVCRDAGLSSRFIDLRSLDFDGSAEELEGVRLEPHRPVVLCSPACAYTGAVVRWAHGRKLAFGKDLFYSDFDNPNSLRDTGVAVASAVQNYAAMGESIYKALRDWGDAPVREFIACRPV